MRRTQRASWDTQTDDALFSKRKGSGRALILIDIMAEPLTVIYIYTNTPNARDDNTFFFCPISEHHRQQRLCGKMKTNYPKWNKLRIRYYASSSSSPSFIIIFRCFSSLLRFLFLAFIFNRTKQNKIKVCGPSARHNVFLLAYYYNALFFFRLHPQWLEKK